jgi:hypothetical protein
MQAHVLKLIEDLKTDIAQVHPGLSADMYPYTVQGRAIKELDHLSTMQVIAERELEAANTRLEIWKESYLELVRLRERNAVTE